MRTADQIAADHLLTQAIEQAHRAYAVGMDEPPEGWENAVIGDYIVVYATSMLADDGEIESDTAHLVRNGNMAPHASLGLLHRAIENV